MKNINNNYPPIKNHLEPLVSICCITYNQVKYIQQCLDGFVMQKTNFKYEVLIHDDASNDGTQKIIREYEQRFPEIIKPHFQKENQFSRGIRGINQRYNFPRARGKFIALCEGDDYWVDELKLQKQIDFLINNPSYVLTSHKREVVDENNQLLPDLYPVDGYHTQCLVFKNILKKDYLNFKAPITNDDTFLLYYLDNFGEFKILNFIGARYRISNSGIWAGVDKNKQSEDLIQSLKFMFIFFKKNKYLSSCEIVKEKLLYRELKYILEKNQPKIKKYYALINYSLRYKNLLGLKNVIRMIIKH